MSYIGVIAQEAASLTRAVQCLSGSSLGSCARGRRWGPWCAAVLDEAHSTTTADSGSSSANHVRFAGGDPVGSGCKQPG